MAEYKVVYGVRNDTTSKEFKPGATVTDEDFPKEVIKHWVDIGVLKRIREASEGKVGDGR